jgi:hypothetical protein
VEKRGRLSNKERMGRRLVENLFCFFLLGKKFVPLIAHEPNGGKRIEYLNV